MQVSCLVSEGDLPFNFTWRFNNEKLERFPEMSTTLVGKRMSILLIDSVSHAHAGNYTCVALNDAGEFAFSAELLVNGYSFMIFLLVFAC